MIQDADGSKQDAGKVLWRCHFVNKDKFQSLLYIFHVRLKRKFYA